MAKSRLRGDKSFRKLLKRMPETAQDEMVDALDQAGTVLLKAMKADVPRRTGALAAGLLKKLLRGSMKLKVGFIGKGVNRKLFYGRIIEYGRRAQTVTVVRGTTRSRSASARSRGMMGRYVKPYKLRVRAMRARPFVYSKRRDVRVVMSDLLRTYWDRVLSEAAQGITYD